MPPLGRRLAIRGGPRWLWTLSLVVLVGAAVAYLAVTALSARRDLLRIQAQLGTLTQELQAGNTAASQPLVHQIQGEAAAAHSITTGPLWWAAAGVPWLGRPADVVRGASQQIAQVAAAALPDVTSAAADLTPSRLRHGHSIELAQLNAALPPLTRAQRVLDTVRRQTDELPSHTWLPPATRGRNLLAAKIDALDRAIDDITQAAAHLPALLGSGGDQRYLVVFQNEAESRGLGGLPGAYAVLQARDGKITFDRFGSDVDLEGASARSVALPEDARRLYGPLNLRGQFLNATLSPNFPTDASVLQAMAEQRLGVHLNGVIATDPTALSYVLGATGPVTTKQGIQLTSANLVSEVESQAYTQFHSQEARKAFLVDAAQASAHAMFSGEGSLSALATALRTAVDQHRLVVYSDSAPTENWLGSTPLGGTLPRTTGPFSAVIVDNAAANKLDYYLDRSVTYTRTTCSAGESETTATLRDSVPTGPLPEYVSGRALHPGQPLGFNELLVFFYATAGAQLDAVTVDGKSVPFIRGSEEGHPVAQIQLDMLPRRDYTVSLFAHEPAASRPVTSLMQPMVRSEAFTTHGPAC
jgi:HAMP domain-containing protein